MWIIIYDMFPCDAKLANRLLKMICGLPWIFVPIHFVPVMSEFETPGADGAGSDKWRWAATSQVGFRSASQVVWCSLAVFKSFSLKFIKL